MLPCNLGYTLSDEQNNRMMVNSISTKDLIYGNFTLVLEPTEIVEENSNL